MGPKNHFIENCSTCVSIEPARSNSMSGLPQIDPNPIKKEMCFKNTFFLTKIRKSMKNDLQKVSKWVSAKRGWRLLGHLWSPKLIFDSKSEPTAPPKCSQGPKNASKMIPKGPKMILKVTLKVHSLGTLTLDRRFAQRPGGLREAH